MMLFHFKYKHFVPKLKKPESGEMAQSINFCCASVRTWVLGLSTRVKRPGVAGCTGTPVSVTPAQGWSKRTVAAHWPSSQSSDSLQVQWETLALKKKKKKRDIYWGTPSFYSPTCACTNTHIYITHTNVHTHTPHTNVHTYTTYKCIHLYYTNTLKQTSHCWNFYLFQHAKKNKTKNPNHPGWLS